MLNLFPICSEQSNSTQSLPLLTVHWEMLTTIWTPTDRQ